MRTKNSRVEYFAGKGLLNFNGTEFVNGRIIFNLDCLQCSSDNMKWRKTNNGFVSCRQDVQFKVHVSGNVFRIEVKNTGSKAVFLNEITILFNTQDMREPMCAGGYIEYIHSDNAGFAGTKKVGLSARWLPHNPESHMVYVLQNRDTGDACLFSTLPPHRGDYVTFKAMHDSPHLEGNFGLEIKSVQKVLLKPTKTASSSSIQFSTGKDPLVLLAQLGQQWKKKDGVPLKDVKTGWNSWDYYAGSITSKQVYDNQKCARKYFKDKIKYFVIDEGWESMWGDWTANRKFFEGLAGFCRRIKSGGGIPGIWTAPLLVNNYTSLFRDNPDWFCRDKNGNIITRLYSYGPMSYLDITRAEVKEFIYNTYRRLRQVGFEYFKVDFTSAILECDNFYDRTVSRGALLRKTFEMIRKAIGSESYLLGCGAPYESVTGVVDAVRVSPDIHNFWGHILVSAGSISARWWMHGNLWNNDPDFLIVRTRETSLDAQLNREFESKPFEYRDSWFRGREMNREEAKVYALVVYLSAGDVMLGDNLIVLNKSGIDILKKVLDSPRLSKPAVPVDLFSKHDSLPKSWLAEEKSFWVLGLFNWEEDYDDVSVNLKDLGIMNYGRIKSFWEEKPVIPNDGVIRFRLNPRSCTGLVIRKGS